MLMVAGISGDRRMPDRQLDKICIRDLACRCIVGINDEERVNKQDILVNITMYADLRKACASDNIEDTVDYKAVKKRVLTLVEDSHFSLIETLAGSIAAVCLDESGVERVRVCVDKPGALRFARSVAVTVTRGRCDDV